jgi:hypothetical protein
MNREIGVLYTGSDAFRTPICNGSHREQGSPRGPGKSMDGVDTLDMRQARLYAYRIKKSQGV